jgi:DNA-binding FadR family transcriptional regulator
MSYPLIGDLRRGLVAVTRIKRSDEIAQAIADLIIDRKLEPGAPLPPEVTLMEDLGVSRNSVRESIKALQALGIVEIRHGYGTFVGSGSSAALQPWLVFRTRLAGGKDTERLAELLEVREILETEVTRRVAVSHEPSLLDALGGCIDRMAAGDPADSAVADRHFHELICNAAGVPLARELVGLFWDVYRTLEGKLETITSTPEQIAKRHQLIVDAIRSGDTEQAEHAVHSHFDDVRQRLHSGPYAGTTPQPSP